MKPVTAIIRVEQLEQILICSVVTYTNYSFTDPFTSTQQQITFQWDSTSPAYASALDPTSVVSTLNSYQSLLTTLSNSWDGSTYSGSAFDTVNGTNAVTSLGNYANNISILAGTSTFDYDPGVTTTIDSSVVDIATARTRAQWLVSDASAKLQANNVMLTTIQTLPDITKQAVFLWNSNKIAQNSYAARRDVAELQLIKAAYPSVFR